MIEQGLEDPGTFSTAVLIALERIDRRLGLLIVVDQLEELFTMCDVDEERRAFADNLAQLGERCPPRAKVVVTLRSDYLDELSQHPKFARLIGARHHLLAPLDEDGLREVIQRPAWRCGVSLEPKLVEEILLDVAEPAEPAAAPFGGPSRDVAPSPGRSPDAQGLCRGRPGDRDPGRHGRRCGEPVPPPPRGPGRRRPAAARLLRPRRSGHPAASGSRRARGRRRRQADRGRSRRRAGAGAVAGDR